MAEFTAAALGALVASGAVAAIPAAPTDALRDAADRLVDLHNRWDAATALELFADNVEPDDAFDRRAAATEAFAEHRPWRLARVESLSATEGTAIAHGEGAELHIDIQLHPLVPPNVQWYEATLYA